MKKIDQIVNAVLALVWFLIAMTYAIKEHNEETSFLAFIICLQYQNLLRQSIDHEKDDSDV